MNATATPRTEDRDFQVWQFLVGHGQLLIRSPISLESASQPARRTNVDLLFAGVRYMAVPRFLRGLVIEAATPDEVAALAIIVGTIDAPMCVTMLGSGGHRFPVVALRPLVTENDCELLESPLWPQMIHRAPADS